MNASLTFILVAFSLLSLSHAQQPNAEVIMANARYVTALNQTQLNGKLKQNRTGREVPVALYMKGKDIQMQYQPHGQKKWRGIHLQLNDKNCELYDVQGSKVTRFPDKKIGKNIENMDLTYEDLSLRFLYWPNPEIVGEDKIKTQSCYIVRVFNPDRRGNYSTCDLWIHKQAAALMKVKAYDWKGKHIKTFQVAELMKIGREYVMKKMKVETIKNDRTQSISYLIFKNPEGNKKGGPRKLR